jgi:hypothetical protein
LAMITEKSSILPSKIPNQNLKIGQLPQPGSMQLAIRSYSVGHPDSFRGSFSVCHSRNCSLRASEFRCDLHCNLLLLFFFFFVCENRVLL